MKRILLGATAIAALIANSAQAMLYDVNRSFSLGPDSATLTGTVDIPLGSYTIMNMGASPFTSVNLTLNVNSVSYNVNNALTSLISGTGRFFINATPTTLIFNTANANGGNPADLVFSDTLSLSGNYYAIGHNGAPGFEAAYTSTAGFNVPATLPTDFASAVVPEPSTCALLLLPFGLHSIRKFRSRK